jgi:hypothetical protein
MKCQQCGKQAVVSYDDGKINLCLDCNLKFQQAANMIQRRNAEMMNYITEQIEFSVGMPGLLPRYKIPTPIIQSGSNTYNNINVNNSNVGSINTGYIESIDLSLSVLNKQGNQDSSNVLKQLTEEIIRNNEIEQATKNEILEQLSFISEELIKPKEKRKLTLIKNVFSSVSTTLSAFTNLLSLWNTFKGAF